MVTFQTEYSDIAEQINQSIEELKRICKSVHIEPQQTHSDVNKEKGKLNILKKEETSFKESKPSKFLVRKRLLQKEREQAKRHRHTEIIEEEYQQVNKIYCN